MSALELATPADLDAVLALDRDVFADRAWSATVWTETLSSGHRRVLVLADAEAAQPTAIAVLAYAGSDADLERIAVHRDARRAGHGRRLLASAITQARADGAARLLLEVATDNVAALALYRAAGARELAVRTGYYADGRDAAVLAIDLTEAR
jgi:[ribosomal protein S18]-alanine N-acetyltransferase